MENLKKVNPKYKTYVLCLTNDAYYWKEHLKGKVNLLNLKNNSYTNKIQRKDLYLEKIYMVKWEIFKEKFKYLLIDLN